MVKVVARVIVVVLSLGVAASCSDRETKTICRTSSSGAIAHCFPDGGRPDAAPPCDLLLQTGCPAGEKCTWLLDALMPFYVGHIGCASNGTAAVGEACLYGPPGATGFDNCRNGLVCSDQRGREGFCRAVCDPAGGAPSCDAEHACITYPHTFATPVAPPLAGLCEPTCDPLTDNDFDGADGGSQQTVTRCGVGDAAGCYGYPSASASRVPWHCMRDVNRLQDPPTGLRHRVQCTADNGCIDESELIHLNSCNQGYLPLLRESSMVSTAICVAICKPKNCYAGNCGANDEDRFGEAPHRCMEPDRVGSFDTSPGGEHCMFSWRFEIADDGTFVRSPTSDSVGVCIDHAKYGFPPCASLPLVGEPNAAEFGCIDTATAGTLPTTPLF